MKKRLLAITLTVLLLISLVPASAFAVDTLISPISTISSNVKASLDNFKDQKEYTDGQFKDVKATDWFADNVKAAFVKGLMKGDSLTTFNPSGNVSYAEAIVIAARINSIFKTSVAVADGTDGEAWYAPAEKYAVEKGIISDEKASDKAISRAAFAQILAKALPEEALAEINNIVDGIIPDVALDADYAEAVYKLYRAGIMIGDEKGKFYPDTNITRAEMAAVITRMADKLLRKTAEFQYGRIVKLEDNLFEGTFDVLDYDFAQWYFDTYYGGPSSGCAAVWKNGLLMRNFDWYINYNAALGLGTEPGSTLIVHTTADPETGRYATVGVAFCPTLTNDMTELSANQAKILPFLTVDIMNSEGLTVAESSVPGVDLTEGTDGSQGKDVTRSEYTMMRAIADYCATVDEAIEYMKSVNYYAADFGYGYREEIHFIVSDETDVAIIEYVNNELTVLRKSDLKNEYFMTNHFRYNGNTAADDTGHGMGYERDAIIRSNYASVKDVETGLELLSKIAYTNTYTLDPTTDDNFWFSEFAGYYDLDQDGVYESNFSVATDHSNPYLQGYVAYAIQQRFADGGIYSWWTDHSTVYDTKNLTLTVANHEKFDSTHTIGIVQANPTK